MVAAGPRGQIRQLKNAAAPCDNGGGGGLPRRGVFCCSMTIVEIRAAQTQSTSLRAPMRRPRPANGLRSSTGAFLAGNRLICGCARGGMQKKKVGAAATATDASKVVVLVMHQGRWTAEAEVNKFGIRNREGVKTTAGARVHVSDRSEAAIRTAAIGPSQL
jgi:hypothetical protein